MNRYKAYLIILKEKRIEENIKEERRRKSSGGNGSGSSSDWIPYPPDRDVHCVWISHAIRTNEYWADTNKCFGMLIPSFLSKELSEEEYIAKSSATQSLMKIRFPSSSFDFNGTSDQIIDQITLNELPSLSISEFDLIEDKNWLTYFRMTELNEDPSIDPTSHSFIQEAIKDYERYLYLVYKYDDKSLPDVNATYKVDLIWHSHMLNTVEYMNDMQRLIGKELPHLPWPKHRSDAEINDIKLHSQSTWLNEFSISGYLNF